MCKQKSQRLSQFNCFEFNKYPKLVRQWWCTPLIPGLGRQLQIDLCEFKASLVYLVSSKTLDRATQSLSRKQNKTKENPRKTAIACVQRV